MREKSKALIQSLKESALRQLDKLSLGNMFKPKKFMPIQVEEIKPKKKMNKKEEKSWEDKQRDLDAEHIDNLTMTKLFQPKPTEKKEVKKDGKKG